MMKRLSRTLLALLVVTFIPAAAAAQSGALQRQKVDVSKLGPQVGERVPDFSLRDQNGRVRDLQSVMGPRGAMLVFFRSADW